MRDSLLDTFHHPLAKKVYTFAAVVFAVAALAPHTLRRLASRFARTLASGTRGVASRLSAVERQHIVALAAGLLLVTSSLAGVVGSLSSTGMVSASGDTVSVYSDSNDNLKYKNASGVVTDTGVQASNVGELADLDGDGTKEVPFTNGSNNNAINYWDPDKDSTVRLVDTGSVVNYLGSSTDADGDGDLEVLYANSGSSAKSVDVNANTNTWGGTIWAMGGVADWDGDGKDEVVYDDGNSNVKHVDIDGGTGTIVSSTDPYGMAQNLTDFNGDGGLEIPFRDSSNNIKLIDESGTISDTGANMNTLGGIGNWDGDGNLELLALNSSDNIVTLESDGTTENIQSLSGTGYPGDIGVFVGGVDVSGTVADGDGDGIDGATVELRQSGSVQQSTATGSDGSYTLSSVSDGDYTVRASSSGHQNSSKSITVSGAAKTVDLTLPKSGTYVQSFRLDDPTGGFPADETVLELYEYQPGAALNGADPWTKVETSQLNSQRKASFRLSEGTTYRVTAKNVVPNQRSAEQSWSGFVASSTLAQPYVLETELVLGDWGDAGADTPTSTPLTPTATPGADATPTPTFVGGGGGTLPDPNADPDGDGIDNVYDPDDDGDGTPDTEEPNQPSYDTYGPTHLSSCTLPSGEDGARLQYYDPGYNTTQLDYNLTGPDGAVYNGSETFDAPIGLWSECVAGSLTDNVTDTGNASAVGNATFENGSTVPLDTNFSASGPSFTNFAPMGDPADTPAEQGTAFGLTALGVGASYLASRRTNVLQGLSARSPVDPVFAGGSALSVLMGLEFASGGAVSAATANGVQTVAPLAGLGAVGYGGYWVYTNYIQGQNVTIRGGS